MVGAGGVGSAFAPIAARRDFFEHIVFADIDESKARSIVDRYDPGDKYSAAKIDATDATQVAACARANDCDAILNAADPRFVMPIFNGALEVGATYLDMAMSLSEPHPDEPHQQTGKKLGDDQFAISDVWGNGGQLALVGVGVEPGAADVFARYAADELFTSIDEIGIRDGADIQIEGHVFAPTFSIWTTIEECLNPPVIWEKERGWFTTEPLSEPEVFDFPDGIGPVECVNVEHEEVLLVPRWIDCNRVTFKYGLGDEVIDVLKTLQKLGLDKTSPVRVRGGEVLTTRCGRRMSAGPRASGRCHDRQDVCRHVGHGNGQGRQPARGLPVSRGRHRGDMGARRRAGGGLADRHQPGDRAGADRRRHLVGARGTGPPRRSNRSRSSIC